MIIWSFDPLETVWEACEIPSGHDARLAADAKLIALPGGRAVLLAGRGVFLNGMPAMPLSALSHRDEVRVGGRLFLFSVESQNQAAPLPEGRSGVACARCKSPLAAGENAVICSVCDSPHHAECFTYDPQCGGCAASTEGLHWIPGGQP
jgi:hypothetical protein